MAQWRTPTTGTFFRGKSPGDVPTWDGVEWQALPNAASPGILGSAQLGVDAGILPGTPYVTLLSVPVVSTRPTIFAEATIGWLLLALLSFAQLRIRVDGVSVAALRQDSIVFVGFRPAGLGVSVPVPPGAHTVDLQWSTNFGCSATCNAGTDSANYSASLLVGEI